MREHLGKRIQHYRELRNISQLDLAALLKVDKGTVWRWEKGKSWPEYDKLLAIAHHLKIEPERLFETIGKEPPAPPPAIEALLETIETQQKRIKELETPLIKRILDCSEEEREKLSDRLDMIEYARKMNLEKFVQPSKKFK